MKPEEYTKVEIVNPSRTTAENLSGIFTGLFGLALRTLIVWWAVASWFPEWGITYWQTVLPVYAIRALIPGSNLLPRAVLRKKD